MARLEIRLFGSMQVWLDGELVHLPPSGRLLLAYLILQRSSLKTTVHSRNLLMEHFWGHLNDKRARHCLSTTLWRLRRQLADSEAFILATSAGDLRFDFASDHWIDVVVFEEKVQQILQRPFAQMGAAEADALEEVRALYCQELLAGLAEDWVYREQEKLNLLYVNSLSRLMQFYEQTQEYEKGLSCGEEILSIDPLREHIHRYMMRLYMNAGRRAKAVQQYHHCRQILAQELGIHPMPETEALFAEIVAHRASQPAKLPLVLPMVPSLAPLNGENGASEQIDLRQLAQNLDQTMAYLAQVQQQLSQVRQAIVDIPE